MQLRLQTNFLDLILAQKNTKYGIFSKDHTYRAFFLVFHKRNFYSDGLKDLNAFVTFVSVGETTDLILAHNSVDNLSIANPKNIVPK